MQLALRPYVTTGIVIAGASALVAAPLTLPPPTLNPTSVAVAPAASVLDGGLQDFDTLFTAGGKSAEVLLGALGDFPEEFSRAFLAAVADPAILPSIGSVFAYGLLNPGHTPIPGTFGDLAPYVQQLAGLLPAPLGPSSPTDIGIVLTVFRALGMAVGHALAELPSPVPGLADMTAVHLPHVVDVLTTDAGIVGEKFGEATTDLYDQSWPP